jgi:hypothetical protein
MVQKHRQLMRLRQQLIFLALLFAALFVLGQ